MHASPGNRTRACWHARLVQRCLVPGLAGRCMVHLHASLLAASKLRLHDTYDVQAGPAAAVVGGPGTTHSRCTSTFRY